MPPDDSNSLSFDPDKPDLSSVPLPEPVPLKTSHAPTGGTLGDVANDMAEDSGAGFDPSDIPHLFERFYRGSNASSESIGIGLALCRAIIVRQNGTITAENAPSGGARFIIKLYKSVV